MGQFRLEFDVPDSKAFHDAFVLIERVTSGLVPKGFFVDGTPDTRGHWAVFSHITDSSPGMKREVILGHRTMPAPSEREEATCLTSNPNFPAGRV